MSSTHDPRHQPALADWLHALADELASQYDNNQFRRPLERFDLVTGDVKTRWLLRHRSPTLDGAWLTAEAGWRDQKIVLTVDRMHDGSSRQPTDDRRTFDEPGGREAATCWLFKLLDRGSSDR